MSFGNLESERYLLHYLTTGATTETTLAELSRVNPAACPLLLRPCENLSDLEDLKATWTEAFPGDAQALSMLRHNLVRAHWEFLRAQAASDEASARYYLAPNPALNPGNPARLLEFFQRQSDRSDRAFTRHLNTLRAWRKDALTLELTTLRLQSARATGALAQSKIQPKAEPPKPVPAEPTSHPPHLLTLFQAVAVTVNPDASIRTEIAPPNAELLATCAHLHQLGKLTSHFVRRHFIFPAIVPDQCAWARVHINADYKTPASKLKLNVYYTADEYIRLTDFEAAHKLQFPVQNPPPEFGDQTIVPCAFQPLQEIW
jgi:hypothetical protein